MTSRTPTFPFMMVLTGLLFSGCATQAQLPMENCASGPTLSPLPEAPAGAYSPTASEVVYTNLIGGSGRKPSAAGALRVGMLNCMATLVDSQGKPVQLRGMSTHGLQWFPEIINDNAFGALADDWGANVIRLAMYVGEGGYATNPQLKQRVLEGIDYAIANDLYVIVDWHVHAPGDPNADLYTKANPLAFFREISQKYPNNSHIIYEVANEPNPNPLGVTNDTAGWASVKAYAEPIIRMLRDTGNQNIVLVGSPNWTQRPDLAADNRIQDANTVYTAHFYSGTHQASNDVTDRTNVMSNVKYALQHGVPVFVSEWGSSEASGNNGPYLQEADMWLDFLNKYNISWINWSLTNKNETSASFNPYELGKSAATNLDPGTDQLWAPQELSVSGEYVRARIKGIAYQPIDRTAFIETVWNFDDGTAQGFGVNSDSPVKTATVSNENGALKVDGLAASTDVSEGNYWANVRLSADGSSAHPNLYGAKTLSMDVLAAVPATVSIAAIPQSATHGWANPKRAVQVTADKFVQQANGLYRATLTMTAEDSPNFAAIASDTDLKGSILTNVILFVGTQNTTTIWLDNISFSGNRTASEQPVDHAPLGQATLPSTFEDGTRQGWAWDAASGVKGALTLGEANGSNALTWEVMYPDVKPTDNWASAPRLVLDTPTLTRGSNNFLVFDLYLKPEEGRGNRGALSVNLSFGPPSLGYWAQAQEPVSLPLTDLASRPKTSDGLYHFPIRFDLNKFDKALTPETALGKINLIVADVESNYAGKMFLDNVQFTPTAQ
ncbi:carbohydrate-binding domain-containing protein [Deinococcus aquatilis]|uniref:carbohydrate-binding domain-containing protein n=1 Tax=Deinococcus aquatilis TaxID=519440 RepID=UPI0003A15FF2|nr:carbohydrate-binding domain-containing protein [Deinococcus aquatilis]